MPDAAIIKSLEYDRDMHIICALLVNPDGTISVLHKSDICKDRFDAEIARIAYYEEDDLK